MKEFDPSVAGLAANINVSHGASPVPQSVKFFFTMKRSWLLLKTFWRARCIEEEGGGIVVSWSCFSVSAITALRLVAIICGIEILQS